MTRQRTLLACLLLAACTEQRRNLPDTFDVGVVHDAAIPLIDLGTSDAVAADSTFVEPQTAVIYAHSSSTLYSFDPQTNRVTRIGGFRDQVSGAAVTQVLDLALNAAGDMYIVTPSVLYQVDVDTAEVTRVLALTGVGSVNGLSFLIPGTVDATEETLVAVTMVGGLIKIDLRTQAVTMLGTYPSGWQSSGDLVSVEGAGTFATVTHDRSGPDSLARITFTAGAAQIEILGATRSGTQSFKSIYGIGYWGRSLYGFTATGELIEINRVDGTAQLVSNSTGSRQFYGAGVTTVAFVIP